MLNSINYLDLDEFIDMDNQFNYSGVAIGSKTSPSTLSWMTSMTMYDNLMKQNAKNQWKHLMLSNFLKSFENEIEAIRARKDLSAWGVGVLLHKMLVLQ